MNRPRHSAQKSNSACPSDCFCSSVLHVRRQLPRPYRSHTHSHSILGLSDLEFPVSFELNVADSQVRSSEVYCEVCTLLLARGEPNDEGREHGLRMGVRCRLPQVPGRRLTTSCPASASPFSSTSTNESTTLSEQRKIRQHQRECRS